MLRALKDWITEGVGDPFETVERYLGRVPEAETVRQLKEAEDIRDQLRFFSLACPLAQRAMATEEGAAKLFHLLLLEKDPKATEEDAFEVATHLNQEEQAAAVVAAAQGGTRSSAEGNAQPAGSGPESAGETSTGG